MSLQDTHPELAEEFDLELNAPLTPDTVSTGSSKKVHWICRTISDNPCGHRWQSTVKGRTRSGSRPPSGCPFCSGRAVHSDGRNSMRTTHSELAEEFDIERNAPLTPDVIKAGTGKMLHWVCRTISDNPCGHRWKATGDSRSRGTGCPACSNKVIHEDGRNSMRSTHPELAEEFDMEKNAPLTPDDVVAGTDMQLFWRCTTISETPCGYEWQTTGNHRAGTLQTGCPVCAGNDIHQDGRNSMRTTYPELAEEFDMEKNAPLTPDIIKAGTNKKLHWVCRIISETPCGYKWVTSGEKRSARGHGCPVCSESGQNAIHHDGRNSMRTTHPELAEEFDMERNHPHTPDNVKAGTHLNLYWVCRTISETPCGHRWLTVSKNRSRNGDGCPACSNRVVHEDGRNSMRNTHPELAEEFDMEKNAPLTPDNVLAGTNKKLHWICRTKSKNPCGKKWEAMSSGRVNPLILSGCPNCAEYGFNQTNPAWYYVYAVIRPDGSIHCYKGGKTNENLDQRFNSQRDSLKDVKGYEDFEYSRIEKIRGSGKFIHKLELKLLKVDKKIRFPPIEGMKGKEELFKINPLDYARENGLLDDWEPLE